MITRVLFGFKVIDITSLLSVDWGSQWTSQVPLLFWRDCWRRDWSWRWEKKTKDKLTKGNGKSGVEGKINQVHWFEDEDILPENVFRSRRFCHVSSVVVDSGRSWWGTNRSLHPHYAVSLLYISSLSRFLTWSCNLSSLRVIQVSHSFFFFSHTVCTHWHDHCFFFSSTSSHCSHYSGESSLLFVGDLFHLFRSFSKWGYIVSFIIMSN